MKAVLDLTKAITDADWYNEQFIEQDEFGNKPDKKILFVAPQLTSKHLYKFILPFFSFYNERIFTAITSLDKYDPFVQIAQLDVTLKRNEIIWADFIVFPFTTMDLTKEFGLYEAIREVNPHCKIVFFVDFNYYALSSDHPHKELFNFPTILDNTEKNILFSDLCLTSNIQLRGFLLKKFTELVDVKYKDIENFPVNFGAIPYLIDEDIVRQNIDFELHKTAPVIAKDVFKKIAEVAEEIKKEDLEVNKDKAKRLASKKIPPKKLAVKTIKVVANKKGKGKVDEKPTKGKGKNKVEEKTTKGKGKGKGKGDVELLDNSATTSDNLPAIDTGASVTPMTDSKTPHVEYKPMELKELPRKYRIGVICSPSSYHDIKFYNEQFRRINERYGDNVNLILVGYDYENDKDKKNILEGVNFEYVKEVSIIHYFKQLENLELDMVFIPLEKNIYNVTSENFNKYLECGIFKIPIIVEDMFPYNHIILNQRNGFTYKGKENLIAELDVILSNYDLVKSVGEQCRKDVIASYTYSQQNIDIISDIYQ